MLDDLKMNADRFTGFADIYDRARPECPKKVTDIIVKYLGRQPDVVLDLGCGTGLSTLIWSDLCNEVIGIEPSEDMLSIAKQKSLTLDNVLFLNALSDRTGLEASVADVITCSQSFHWMNPKTTLDEVDRVLKDGGVFAIYDCDWPPVCNWEVEKEYDILFHRVKEFEETKVDLKNSFKSWPKDKHLENMKNLGNFRYVREVVFSNSEECDAERFIQIALSQGGLQGILKTYRLEFEPYVTTFKEKVQSLLGSDKFIIDFCYRMRLGVK